MRDPVSYTHLDVYKRQNICNTKALDLIGREFTVEQVIAEVLKDQELYDLSGGGMTLTGGEPLVQPTFALALLQAAHVEGIHTAIETAGCVSWNTIERISKETDLFLYDLKGFNPKQHFLNTGQDNKLILTNLQRLAQEHHIIVRMPLILSLIHIFRTADGGVYAAGCNYDYGQLGDGSGLDRSMPVKVMDGGMQVAASHDFSCLLYTSIELVKRGHQLVADDVVDIRRVSDDRLVGESPELVRHFMEIRGVGIIDIATMYGVGAVIRSKTIDLEVKLENWQQGKEMCIRDSGRAGRGGCRRRCCAAYRHSI